MTRSGSASGMLVGGSTPESLVNGSRSWSPEFDTVLSGFVVVVSSKGWRSCVVADTDPPTAVLRCFAVFRRRRLAKSSRSLPPNSMVAVALV